MRTELWMRTRKTSFLDPKQKTNRNNVMNLLHEYWKKEEFPINNTHNQKIPQIKDTRGTPCALAYILQNSGKQQLVDEIAQQNNNVYVNDVPENHPLNYAIKEGGFTKKEAATIQPSYSCRAIVGQIQTGEPIVEFLGIILAITGSAVAMSFFWGLNNVSYNVGKGTIKSAIILGIVVMVGGLGMTYQNSMAEPFGKTSFHGDFGSVNIVDDVAVYYWIDGGQVTSEGLNGNYFEIKPERDGQITIAYPPIITEGYENYYQDNYFSHSFVLLNGEEISTDTYGLKGYQILTVEFGESDNSIEIIGAGLCGNFIFDEKTNP